MNVGQITKHFAKENAGWATVTLQWSSDGTRSFALSVTAGPDPASTHILVSAIDLVRVWLVVAGSPRFVEPSLAGRASEASHQ